MIEGTIPGMEMYEHTDVRGTLCQEHIVESRVGNSNRIAENCVRNSNRIAENSGKICAAIRAKKRGDRVFNHRGLLGKGLDTTGSTVSQLIEITRQTLVYLGNPVILVSA